MVKGISRQVIVVHSPDKKLFEQAIFILNEKAGQGITDEVLLREARQAIQTRPGKKRNALFYGPAWACAGALATGAAWFLTTLL